MKSSFWVAQIADKVVGLIERTRGSVDRVVCSSGISPSGPIHLGNLREFLTVHFVTEELLRRGIAAEHVHIWDDYDRFRKVPAGVPESFSEKIGMPLADVPDPHGEFGSYAERFMSELTGALERLGVAATHVRQSDEYRRGAYRDLVKRAMSRRFDIFGVLAEYQTAGRDPRPYEERRAEYYPFKVYCGSCSRDATRITSYDEPSTEICYTCSACGHEACAALDGGEIEGKLVWKVDWPMRWTHYGVDFEPAGEDHSSPGSSFTVGQKLIREVFDAHPPYYVGYAFVGATGQGSKLSGSEGTWALPATALEIMEPAILRWLYARQPARKSFSIDFGTPVLRLYDEWDAFTRRVEEGKVKEVQARLHEMCVATSAGPVARSEQPVAFRLLSSSADITQGNVDQICRIVAAHLDDAPPLAELARRLELRLGCAIAWAGKYLPRQERTILRRAFAAETWEALDDDDRAAVRLLLGHLGDDWTLAGLTRLVYGVPKIATGLDWDDPPTPEVKQAQRRFFVALYRLLCGRDTGPRLPTLFLSIGEETARRLLDEESA